MHVLVGAKECSWIHQQGKPPFPCHEAPDAGQVIPWSIDDQTWNVEDNIIQVFMLNVEPDAALKLHTFSLKNYTLWLCRSATGPHILFSQKRLLVRYIGRNDQPVCSASSCLKWSSHAILQWGLLWMFNISNIPLYHTCHHQDLNGINDHASSIFCRLHWDNFPLGLPLLFFSPTNSSSDKLILKLFSSIMRGLTQCVSIILFTCDRIL